MLAAELCRQLSRSAACSRSAATRTTSRSGAAATLLTLMRSNPELEVDWVVLGAPGARADEARASAEAFLAGAATAARRGARLP